MNIRKRAGICGKANSKILLNVNERMLGAEDEKRKRKRLPFGAGKAI